MGWRGSFEGEYKTTAITRSRVHPAGSRAIGERRRTPPRMAPIFCRFGATRGHDQPVFCFRPWAECRQVAGMKVKEAEVASQQ